MDPITAGLNLATQALKLYEMFYASLTPEQRQTYNQPFVDGMKRWGEITAALAALMKPQA